MFWNNKKEEYVECAKCSFLVNKYKTYAVKVINGYTEKFLFCEKCKPPYNKVRIGYEGTPDRFFKEIEVDIEGKPI